MSQHRGKQAYIQTYWQPRNCQVHQKPPQKQSETEEEVATNQEEIKAHILYFRRRLSTRQNYSRLVAVIGGQAATTTTNAATATAPTISTAQAVPTAEIGDFEKFKHKMANTLSVMTNVLRHVVSKKRRRYKEKGFNLDLAYISDNIIAMGYPADNIEKIYRNRYEDVYKFLEENHKDHYKIYNLCLERSHDRNKFHGRIAVYPFEDHNPPTIDLIQRFCEDVDTWLKADSHNVAAVHCKAGKGRTGTMICCYLMYSGQQKTSEDALSCYDEKRTKDGKGVTIPSQRRYVQYFSQLIQSGAHYEKRTLQLCEIRFIEASLLQNQGTVNCSISVLQDTATTVEVQHLQTEAIDFRKSFTLDMKNPALTVCGDIKIELTHRTSKKKIFHFWFNTYFVSDASLVEGEGDDRKFIYTLNKSEIDDAHKDKEHKCFSEHFRVQLVFFADYAVSRNHSTANNRIINNQRTMQCSTTNLTFAINYDELATPPLPPPPLPKTATTTSTTNYILEQKSSSSMSSPYCLDGDVNVMSILNSSTASMYDTHNDTKFRNRLKEQQKQQLQTQSQVPAFYNNMSNNILHHTQQFAATSTPNAKKQPQHSVGAAAVDTNCITNDAAYFNDFGQQLQQQHLLQQYQPSASVPKMHRELQQQQQQHIALRVCNNQEQSTTQQHKQKMNHTLHNSKNNSISSHCSTAVSNNSSSSSSKNNSSSNCSNNSSSSNSSTSCNNSHSSNSSANSADNDNEEDWESGESPAAKQLPQQNELLLSTIAPTMPTSTTTTTTTTTNNNNNNTTTVTNTNKNMFPNISFPINTNNITTTTSNPPYNIQKQRNENVFVVGNISKKKNNQQLALATTDVDLLLNLHSNSHKNNHSSSSVNNSNICNFSHTTITTTAATSTADAAAAVATIAVDNSNIDVVVGDEDNETLRICGGEDKINVTCIDNVDDVDGDYDDDDDDYVHIKHNVVSDAIIGADNDQANIVGLVQVRFSKSKMPTAAKQTVAQHTTLTKPIKPMLLRPSTVTPMDANSLLGSNAMALNIKQQQQQQQQEQQRKKQQQQQKTIELDTLTSPSSRQKLLQKLTSRNSGNAVIGHSITKTSTEQMVPKHNFETKCITGNMTTAACSTYNDTASSSSNSGGGIVGGNSVFASSSKQKLKNKFKKNKLKWSMKFQWFQKYFRNDPDDFRENVMQQTTKIVRRNSTCSVLSRTHKLSTSTPPPPPLAVALTSPPVISMFSPPALIRTPSSKYQQHIAKCGTVNADEQQQPIEAFNFVAKLSSSLPSSSSDFAAAASNDADVIALQRKSSCASASISNASISIGDVCEDFYSSLCDNQLSFNNSPCKSPRSLADSLSYGGGTPGSYGGRLRLHSECSLANQSSLLANFRRNVVIVAAKPAEQHAIGFNVHSDERLQQQQQQQQDITLPLLHVQPGRVPPLAVAEPTTPNSWQPESAATTASSIYYTPPTKCDVSSGSGSSNSNNKNSNSSTNENDNDVGPFVFPRPLSPVDKVVEEPPSSLGSKQQRSTALNLLIPKEATSLSSLPPMSDVKRKFERDSMSSASASEVDEEELMMLAGKTKQPFAVLHMGNVGSDSSVGGNGDVAGRGSTGSAASGLLLGDVSRDRAHTTYACSNSSSSGVCTSECCTNSSSSSCSYNPLQIDLERHVAKQQQQQQMHQQQLTTTTNSGAIANVTTVALQLARTQILETDVKTQQQQQSASSLSSVSHESNLKSVD